MIAARQLMFRWETELGDKELVFIGSFGVEIRGSAECGIKHLSYYYFITGASLHGVG